MVYVEGIARARSRARRLLARCGVEAMHHVVVEAFAEHLGVPIAIAPLEGASAQLIVAGTQASIQISDRIESSRRRRFAIAHELGHYVLQHPLASVADLHGHAQRNQAHEDEADAFAEELLMPLSIVAKWCEGRQMTLGPARELAIICEIPVEMSARRIAQATTRACAAVLSDARGIVWSVRSAQFDRFYSRVPFRLDRRSFAWRTLRQGAELGPELVAASTWLEGSQDPPLLEHSIIADQDAGVVTMLWASEREAAETARLADRTLRAASTR